jgi:hypothetical protein
MAAALVTVTAVSDEGNQVIVWGRVAHPETGTDAVGFVFRATGDDANAELAEQASRLRRDSTVIIEYRPVVGGWNLATKMSAA